MPAPRPGRLPAYLAALLAWLPASVVAHPVSQVGVDADVETNAVNVAVEVKTEDLVWFHLPAATNHAAVSATLLHQAAIRHQAVLSTGLHIYNEHGTELHGTVLGIDTGQIDRDELPAAELKTATVRYRFTYPLQTAPAYLTFRQTIGGTNSPVPCSMDLSIRRAGKFTAKPVNLPAGVPHSIELDWMTPAPTSLSEMRVQKAARLQRRLGITSFSGLHSFIHLGPSGVRHELILSLPDLHEWLPANGGDNAAEQARLEAFIRTNCPVSIDGAVVPPVVAGLRRHGLDTIDFAQPAPSTPNHPYQTRVAIVIRYPVTQPPRHVRLRWSAFTKQIPFVKSTVFSPNRSPQQTYFTAQRPSYNWHAAAENSDPLTRLMQEICHRLDLSPDSALIAQLRQDVGADVRTARLIEVSKSSAVWRMRTTEDHWGHRHEREQELGATYTVTDQRLRDFQVVHRSTVTERTYAIEVAAQTFIR